MLSDSLIVEIDGEVFVGKVVMCGVLINVGIVFGIVIVGSIIVFGMFMLIGFSYIGDFVVILIGNRGLMFFC